VRLLLVEDDERIAEPLVDGLTRMGFDVDWVVTGAEALQYRDPEVVLLDLGLPDVDGTVVCRELRSRAPLVSIIVITARNGEDDRVTGLDSGADDYVVKPFGMRELEARIRAVSRRVQVAGGLVDGGVQDLGRLVIDRRAHRVSVDGAEVALTPKEFALLALLAEDQGAIVKRQVVFDEVWDSHWYGPTKTLEVHVASLRRRLGHPEWIETVRGVGLRLGRTD
jgi:two-component system response regulator RegX3